MKIAYIFSIYKDFDFHAKVFKMLDEPYVDFYVHIDKKSKIDLKKYIKEYGLEKIHFLKNRMSVYWGGFTQIQSTLRLFKAVRESGQKYDRIIFMTDNEFPVWSNKKIHDFFEQHKDEEFMLVARPDIPNDFEYPVSRVNTYTFYDCPLFKNMSRKKLNKIMYRFRLFQRDVLGITRKLLPYRYYRGHSKFYITQNFMNFVLDYVKNNPKDLNTFKHTCCADEIFFTTLLMNSEYKNKLNENLYRFHIWGPIGPIVLDMSYKDKILNAKPMITAKILPDKSKELIEFLEYNRID